MSISITKGECFLLTPYIIKHKISSWQSLSQFHFYWNFLIFQNIWNRSTSTVPLLFSCFGHIMCYSMYHICDFIITVGPYCRILYYINASSQNSVVMQKCLLWKFLIRDTNLDDRRIIFHGVSIHILSRIFNNYFCNTSICKFVIIS